MILTVLRVELTKVFSKWRTIIGFLVIAVIVPVVIVAMKVEGMRFFQYSTQALQDAFTFTGNLMNGYTISYIILGMLYIHVPFLTTLVAGDILAGEATAGTYRVLLTRPVSRFSVVTAKWMASMVYANLLVLLMAILSIVIGLLVLGTGELLVVRSQIVILAQDDIIWRLASAYAFAALSMSTVAAIAFLFSSLVENAIGPIMTTMGIIIVLTILSSIDTPLFDPLRKVAFTSHMIGWRFFFDQVVDWSRVSTSALVLVGHIVVCFIATQFIMHRKDILT
ncbi:MAG: ABC transporter permease subunit [bacterium]|nr:ABC transporter permease subunit [bacterium]